MEPHLENSRSKPRATRKLTVSLLPSDRISRSGGYFRPTASKGLQKSCVRQVLQKGLEVLAGTLIGINPPKAAANRKPPAMISHITTTIGKLLYC